MAASVCFGTAGVNGVVDGGDGGRSSSRENGRERRRGRRWGKGEGGVVGVVYSLAEAGGHDSGMAPVQCGGDDRRGSDQGSVATGRKETTPFFT